MLKSNFNTIAKSVGKEIINELMGELVVASPKDAKYIGKLIKEFSSSDDLDEKELKKLKKEQKQKKKKELEEKIKRESVAQAREKAIAETMVSKKNPGIYARTDHNFSLDNISTEKLKEAVVWSEILGEPACRKRRNRR